MGLFIKAALHAQFSICRFPLGANAGNLQHTRENLTTAKELITSPSPQGLVWCNVPWSGQYWLSEDEDLRIRTLQESSNRYVMI